MRYLKAAGLEPRVHICYSGHKGKAWHRQRWFHQREVYSRLDSSRLDALLRGAVSLTPKRRFASLLQPGGIRLEGLARREPRNHNSGFGPLPRAGGVTACGGWV